MDVTTGYFNCIWQGDANDLILRALTLAASPPAIFNLTGREIWSVRDVAERFGRLMQRTPQFAGKESDTALLSKSSRLFESLGIPPTPIDQVLQWTAHWIMQVGRTFNKPTHFEIRDGQY